MGGNETVSYIRRLLEMEGIKLDGISKEQLEEYARTYSQIVAKGYIQRVDDEASKLLDKNLILERCRTQAAILLLAMFAQNSTIMTPLRLPITIVSYAGKWLVSHLNPDGNAPELNPFKKLVMWRARKLSSSLTSLLFDENTRNQYQYTGALGLSTDNKSEDNNVTTLINELNKLSGMTGGGGQTSPLPINADSDTSSNSDELEEPGVYRKGGENNQPGRAKRTVKRIVGWFTNRPDESGEKQPLIEKFDIRDTLSAISKSTGTVAAVEAVGVDVDGEQEESAENKIKRKYGSILNREGGKEDTNYCVLLDEMEKAKDLLELVSHPDGTNFTEGRCAYLLPSILKFGSDADEYESYALTEIISLYRSLSKIKKLIIAYLKSDLEQHEGYRYAIILRDINQKMKNIHTEVFDEINKLLTKTGDNTFFDLVNKNETRAQTTFNEEYVAHPEGSPEDFKTTLFDNDKFKLKDKIGDNKFNACNILPLTSAYFLNEYYRLMLQGQFSNKDQRKTAYKEPTTTNQECVQEVQTHTSPEELKTLNSSVKSTCQHVASGDSKQTPLFVALYYRYVKKFHKIDFFDIAKKYDLRLGSEQHNVSADLEQDIDNLIKLIELLQYKELFEQNKSDSTAKWRGLYETLCNPDAPEMHRQTAFTILNKQFTTVLEKTAKNTDELYEYLYGTIAAASNAKLGTSTRPAALAWFDLCKNRIIPAAGENLNLNCDRLVTSDRTFSELGINQETANLFAGLNTAIMRCDITKIEKDDNNLVTQIVDALDDIIRQHNDEKAGFALLPWNRWRNRKHNKKIKKDVGVLQKLRTDVLIKSMQFARRQLETSFDLKNELNLEQRKQIQEAIIKVLTSIKEKNGKDKTIEDEMNEISNFIGVKKTNYSDDLDYQVNFLPIVLLEKINESLSESCKKEDADRIRMLSTFFSEVLANNNLCLPTMGDGGIKKAITALCLDLFKSLDVDAYNLFTKLSLNNHIDEETQNGQTEILTTRLDKLLTENNDGKRTIKSVDIKTGSLIQTVKDNPTIHADGLRDGVKKQIKLLFNAEDDNDNNVTLMCSSLEDKIYRDSQFATNTVYQKLTDWLNANKDSYAQDQLNTALNAQASIAIRELFIQHFFDIVSFLGKIDNNLAVVHKNSVIKYISEITNKGTIDHGDITTDNLVLIVKCYSNTATFDDTTRNSIETFPKKFVEHMRGRFDKGELTLKDVDILHAARDLFTKHNIDHDTEKLKTLVADVDRVVEINSILTKEMFAQAFAGAVEPNKLHEEYGNLETSLGKIVSAYQDLHTKYSQYYDSKSIDTGKQPIDERIEGYEKSLVIDGETNKLGKLLEPLKTASSDAKKDTANTALSDINENSKTFLENRHAKLFYATFIYAERDLKATSCLTHRDTVIEILKTTNEILDKYLELDSKALNTLNYDNFKEAVYFARTIATAFDGFSGEEIPANLATDIFDKHDAMKTRKSTCTQFLQLTDELADVSASEDVSSSIDQICEIYSDWKGKYSDNPCELEAQFKVKQLTNIANLLATALLDINDEISALLEKSNSGSLSMQDCHRAEELAQLLRMLRWLGKDINDQFSSDNKSLAEQIQRTDEFIKKINDQFSNSELHPAFDIFVCGDENSENVKKKKVDRLIVLAVMRLRNSKTLDALNSGLTIMIPAINEKFQIDRTILNYGYENFNKLPTEIETLDYDRYTEEFMPIFREETKRIAADLTIDHNYKYEVVATFQTCSRDILIAKANQLAEEAKKGNAKKSLSEIYRLINLLLVPGSSAALETKINGWFAKDADKIAALINSPESIDYKLDSVQNKWQWRLLKNKYGEDKKVAFGKYLESLAIENVGLSIVADDEAIESAIEGFDAAINAMPADSDQNGEQSVTDDDKAKAFEKSAKALKILAILTQVKHDNDNIVANYLKYIKDINATRPIERSYIESVVNAGLDQGQTLTKENIFDSTVEGLADSFIKWRNLLVANTIANTGSVDASNAGQVANDNKQYANNLKTTFTDLTNNITTYNKSEQHNYREFNDFMYQNIRKLFRMQIDANLDLDNVNKKEQLKAVLGSLYHDGASTNVTTLRTQLLQELHTNLGRRYAELLFADGDNGKSLELLRDLIKHIAEITSNETLQTQVKSLNDNWNDITSANFTEDKSDRWYEAFKTVILPYLLANDDVPQESQEKANFAMGRFIEVHKNELKTTYPSPVSSSASSDTKSTMSMTSTVSKVVSRTASLFSPKAKKTSTSGTSTPSLNGDATPSLPELPKNPTQEQRLLCCFDLALLWLANNDSSRKAKAKAKAKTAIEQALANVGKDEDEGKEIYVKICNYMSKINEENNLSAVDVASCSAGQKIDSSTRTAAFVEVGNQPIDSSAKLSPYLQMLYNLQSCRVALQITIGNDNANDYITRMAHSRTLTY